MKLRNKKTGDIVELKLIQVNDKYIEDHEVNFLNGEKLSLKLLTNSFDDIKEPLIKDEKIRKAVRAWAELCGIDKCHFEHNDGSFVTEWYGISLPTSKHGEDIESGVYTIAELCGEEEE